MSDRLSLRAGLDDDQTATAPFLNPSSCLHPVTAQAPPERVTGSCALTQPPYPLYSNLSSVSPRPPSISSVFGLFLDIVNLEYLTGTVSNTYLAGTSGQAPFSILHNSHATRQRLFLYSNPHFTSKELKGQGGQVTLKEQRS